MWLVGLLILVIGVVISVALHELGHLLPAKKFGAAVPEYWIGFGPEIWKTKIRGTTYGIKAILLGGFVRIVGMFPPTRPGEKTTKADGSPTLAQQARLQSEEDVAKARLAGVSGVPFYQLSTPKKLLIMTGGPLMNLLICIVLVTVVLLGFGWQVPSTTIATVVNEDGPSPAATAGIQPGDTVSSWNGTKIEDWDQLRSLIQETPESGATAVLERDGELVDASVVPEIGEDGQRYVGIISELQRQRGNLGDVGTTVWSQFTGTGKAILALPKSLFELGGSIFTGEERDPNGVISIVGVAQIAGQITTPDSFSSEQQTAQGTVTVAPSFEDRVVMMLSLLASLNMALFVFNLIPLPPLDGGHVVGAIYGGAKNTVAKLTGRPKPPPADTAHLMPLTYAVFGALIVMTLILVVADIVNPVSIT